MYFLQQLKNQFTMQLASYQETPEGPREVEGPAQEAPDVPVNASDLQTRAGEVTGEVDAAVTTEENRGLIANNPHEANGFGAEVEVAGGETGTELVEGGEETRISTEILTSETLTGLSSQPPFDGMDESEIQEFLSQVEVPEGMTEEEALETAMRGRVEESQNNSITRLSETLDESILDALNERYGADRERFAAISDIYAELAAEEGFVAPETPEEFEAMIEARIAELEAEALAAEEPGAPVDAETVASAARDVLSGASAGHMRGYSNPERYIPSGEAPNLRPGSAEVSDAQLNEAIENAPTPKARELLEMAASYLGKHEVRDREELQSFLGFDPTQTPWCKGFTNSCARAVGIPLNSGGSLSSLTGVNDGRRLSQNEQPLPGDVVVCRREGGGHIGFCLGISPSGHPIIVGGNQSNMVSVKEETRPLVGISRIAGEPSETPTATV